MLQELPNWIVSAPYHHQTNKCENAIRSIKQIYASLSYSTEEEQVEELVKLAVSIHNNFYKRSLGAAPITLMFGPDSEDIALSFSIRTKQQLRDLKRKTVKTLPIAKDDVVMRKDHSNSHLKFKPKFYSVNHLSENSATIQELGGEKEIKVSLNDLKKITPQDLQELTSQPLHKKVREKQKKKKTSKLSQESYIPKNFNSPEPAKSRFSEVPNNSEPVKRLATVEKQDFGPPKTRRTKPVEIRIIDHLKRYNQYKLSDNARVNVNEFEEKYPGLVAEFKKSNRR